MDYNFVFTLDYEIHGNGDGSPMLLMVAPTYRLMSLLEKYGQRLTIMADVAEILKFKEYYQQYGRDDYSIMEIEKQLKYAVTHGHNVQLHIHSSYFKAQYKDGHFDQFIDEYNMAALPKERIVEMVSRCKNYLESLLKPVCPSYRCSLFRAANWSMMPTENIYGALLQCGITSDTSVYKGGCQGGNVCYDYRNAADNLLSYPASKLNINNTGNDGITEYPIYSEQHYWWYFITPMRIFRMVRAKFHKHKKSSIKTSETANSDKNDNRKLSFKTFFRKSTWKLDFSQAEGWQLINATKRILKRRIEDRQEIAITLIGHSKTFFKHNEKELEKYLKWINSNVNQSRIQRKKL